MEKRIELEKRARMPSQITDLNLDNCRSTSIVGFTDEYTALQTLSLINVGLTTLKGFPKLPSLKKLELSDNRISNGLNYLTTSPKLEYLILSGNKIRDIETLKPLEELKYLAVLDLFNNEVTKVENYREKIFAMLPSLTFLDGFDCNDVEASSDGEDEEDMNGNDSDDNSINQSSAESSNEEDEGEGEAGEDEEDSDEDEFNGGIGLAEVYNDDLEEDNSDWDEEDGGEEDDDDDTDEDEADEANESGAAAAAATAAAGAAPDAAAPAEEKNAEEDAAAGDESQARGKKRKHDG